jgi:hypothetical protein
MSFRTFLRNLSTEKNLNIITGEVNKTNNRNSTFLLDSIKQYDNTIKRLSSAKALIDLVVKEIGNGISKKTILEMFGILKKLFEKGVRNYEGSDSAIQADYKNIRKPIIELYGKDSDIYKKSITNMKFDQVKWKTNNADYNKAVADKNSNRIQFSDIDIYKIMNDIKNNPKQDFINLSIAAQLSSGSRINEILTMASYKPLKDRDNYVEQIGISKQNHKEESKQRKHIIKPILHYSVSEFLDMIDKIREQQKIPIKKIKEGSLTHDAYSRSQNGKINARIKKMFNDKNMTSHMLRKIYGNMSYNIFGNKNKTSLISHLSDVLGHQEKSLNVAMAYNTVKITTSKLEIKEHKEDKPIADRHTQIPANLKIRDGKGYERLKQTIKIMELKGVKITALALRNLGYGAKLTGQYMKEMKNKKK